jgi:hypothetical protein
VVRDEGSATPALGSLNLYLAPLLSSLRMAPLRAG